MEQTILNKKTSYKLVDLIDGWMAHSLNSRAKRFIKNRDHKLAIFSNDLIGIHINCFGYYEYEDLDIMFEFLDPLADDWKQCCALDIGANIGNHSSYFSEHFEEIHSFEPNPDTFAVLNINTRFIGNVTPYNFGLGKINSTHRMTEDPGNSGGAEVVTDASVQNAEIDVSIKRLDEVPFSLPIRFIKIDVEGQERNVIEGGLSTIREHQPVIAMEQRRQDFTFDEEPAAIQTLRNEGYQFCWYKQGSHSSGNSFTRKFSRLAELFLGRTDKIILSDNIPQLDHQMIIGIPAGMRDKLKLPVS